MPLPVAGGARRHFVPSALNHLLYGITNCFKRPVDRPVRSCRCPRLSCGRRLPSIMRGFVGVLAHGHRIDDRLYPAQCLIVTSHVLELGFHAGDHGHKLGKGPHFLDLLQLVRENPAAKRCSFPDFFSSFLLYFNVNGFLRLFNERNQCLPCPECAKPCVPDKRSFESVGLFPDSL